MLILFRLVKHVSVPCNIQFIESFEGFDKQYYTYRGSKFLIVNSAFRGRLCSVDREALSRNMAWITLQISINTFFEVRRTNKRNEDKLFFFFPKKTTKKKKCKQTGETRRKYFSTISLKEFLFPLVSTTTCHFLIALPLKNKYIKSVHARWSTVRTIASHACLVGDWTKEGKNENKCVYKSAGCRDGRVSVA